MSNSGYDSLIFDMDGTMWDAVDSYAAVWNRTIAQLGVDRKDVRRDELVAQMGRKISDICDSIIPGLDCRDRFLELLAQNEAEMMPLLGGRLYEGVRETMPALAERYRLYMVSNCGDRGLQNFMDFTGLRPYITDTLTYGENLQGKAYNIRAIVERNGLKNPLYIGDTQSDADASHQAGVPFGWVSYGFGTCTDAEYQFDSFAEIANKLR